jgi:tetratricopeptide (TPR) repeat protein
MAKWTAFPYDGQAYRYDAAALKKLWPRLHAGDAEPWPKDERVLAAWALFHAGDFQKACEAGLKAAAAGSPAGINVANKAQCIHANYLEKSEKTKLAMLLEAAGRAEALQASQPKMANAWYWQAYALGRYSQGISVAKALSEGLGITVKTALETTIRLAPRHADAHIALGSFHAEVIDKVGQLLGMTQGADAATGLKMFQKALALNPTSAIAMIEYANGLVMLEGERRMQQAEQLYVDAAACTPLDAMERLDVEMARAELEDE